MVNWLSFGEPPNFDPIIIEVESLAVLTGELGADLGQLLIHVFDARVKQAGEGCDDLLLMLAGHDRLKGLGVNQMQQQLALGVG
ncbi:hypothetical protein K2Z83_28285 [Oscillochloris sp. ZM17-4]|uniref:hypothetical protein n=1 Tax=Oscillochloris sp. ZM17-4 TaxID=2866714 RepID=UPI001C730155|nr:hypothetical protein [Oscillochloris sp. ZM17-4]MBX0331555.1 hypothetical protein [Oscillochloris sp. ZM17-4]